MDIKSWFENGTNLKIKELHYLSKPSIPYNIYIDEISIRGADNLNNVIEHDITIEHYFDNKSDEKIIEKFLDDEKIHYEKNKDWLQDEALWVSVYNLETIIEKRKDLLK